MNLTLRNGSKHAAWFAARYSLREKFESELQPSTPYVQLAKRLVTEI